MSQLLLRLQQDLAAETDVVRRAELLALTACGLARFGRFDEARNIIVELRRAFGDGRHGRITVWIMLAEGLCEYYSDQCPKALDRLTRAQLLSGAIKYPRVYALASAWKAHVEYDMSNFDAMIRSLKIAMGAADDSDQDVQARIAIVVCNAFSLCGQWDQANSWFVRGRKHALLEGDQASIEALQYNRASLRLTHLRIKQCIEEPEAGALRVARSEYESSRNLQALTGVDALTHHLKVCGARLLFLEGRFPEAIDSLNALRSKLVLSQHHFSDFLIDLEISYCQFRIGQINEARPIFDSINFSTFGDLDIDDQLVSASLRHEMALADPAFGDAAVLERQLAELKGVYLETNGALKAGLEALCEDFARATTGAPTTHPDSTA